MMTESSMNNWKMLLTSNSNYCEKSYEKPNSGGNHLQYRKYKLYIYDGKYLTAREAQVFNLLFEGNKRCDLPVILNRHYRTIETAIVNAMRKFGMHRCENLLEYLKQHDFKSKYGKFLGEINKDGL